MFDVSFAKLAVIGVVALIVVGPRRLPLVARTIGKLLGRVQHYSSQIKAQFNREIAAQEWRDVQEKMQQPYHLLARNLDNTSVWPDNFEQNNSSINQPFEDKSNRSYQEENKSKYLSRYFNDIGAQRYTQRFKFTNKTQYRPLLFVTQASRNKYFRRISHYSLNRRIFPKIRK